MGESLLLSCPVMEDNHIQRTYKEQKKEKNRRKKRREENKTFLKSYT